MKNNSLAWILVCLGLALFACKHNENGNGNGGGGDVDASGGGGGGSGDASVDAPPFSGMCTPGGPQCSNCIDDDHDGKIDGFDPECTGARDNDESSFETGIHGDNMDAVEQDCFFDGNSGAGNDGCNQHVCCLLGATNQQECPIGAQKYNVNECPPPLGMQAVSQKCIDHCGKLAPPGCDCFGCCTLCDPTNPTTCFDVIINPLDSVGCNSMTLGDPTKCLRCIKNTMCNGGACGMDTCVLCPGQPPSSLPPGCNGMNQCPNGAATCTNGTGCPMNSYCQNGCCLDVIL